MSNANRIRTMQKFEDFMREFIDPATGLMSASDLTLIIGEMAGVYAAHAFPNCETDHEALFFKKEWLLVLFQHISQQCGLGLAVTRPGEAGQLVDVQEDDKDEPEDDPEGGPSSPPILH